MTTIERSALIGYSDQRMFELVNDIQAYPQYMPGCSNAEVLELGEGWVMARLELSRMGIKQSFVTRNTLTPPESMVMSLVEGPFRSFEGEWRFVRLSDDACKVIFRLEFDIANTLVALALPRLVEQVASEQVDALCKRAKRVYG